MGDMEPFAGGGGGSLIGETKHIHTVKSQELKPSREIDKCSSYQKLKTKTTKNKAKAVFTVSID